MANELPLPEGFEVVEDLVAQAPKLPPIPEGFEEVAQPQEPPGAVETFAQQAAQSASFGYIPEITGAASSAALADTNRKREQLGQAPISYTDLRDQTAAELQAGKEANPKSAIAGTIAGALLSPAVGASYIAKGAGLGARALRAAGVGAGLGLLQNPGQIQGEVSPLQPMDRLRQAALGGAIGGAVPLVGAAAKKTGELISEGAETIAKKIGLENWAEKLKKKSYEVATKSLGGYRSKENRKIAEDLARVQSLGKEALESEVVSMAPKTARKMADVSYEKIDEIGQELGKTIDDIAARSETLAANGIDTSLDRSAIAAALRKDLTDSIDNAIPGTETGASKIEELITDWESKQGPLDIKTAQKIKERLGKEHINWKRLPSEKASPEAKFYEDLYSKLRDGIEDKVEEVAGAVDGPAARDAYVKLKNAYRNQKDIARITNERAGRESFNRYISISDYQSGQFGGGLGTIIALAGKSDPATALLTGVASAALSAGTNKAARQYGPQLKAAGLYKVAKAVEKSPGLSKLFGDKIDEALKGSGTVRLMRTYNAIKNSPEYKKEVKE